jgi:K+ transporter
MIQRTFLSLVFAILLVFAQQGAMLHSYMHTADWQQKSSNESKSTNHTEACGMCVALANLGSAVSSQAHISIFSSGQFELSTALHQSIISRCFLPYQSRAPPILA